MSFSRRKAAPCIDPLMHDIDVSEEGGVRYLHFGSEWIQGAMRIARPWSLELDYTREMMLPLLLRDAEWPRRVLLIGLGSGSLTKFLWKHRPDAKLTVVEIDPRMEAVASMHFKLPHDPARIRIHVEDGADFVARTRQKFDLILVDGFDADARANALDTLPFYALCRTRLAREGLLCVNLLSRRRDFARSVAHIEVAFDEHAIAFPSCASGNAIALAGEPSADVSSAIAVSPALTSHELIERVLALKKTTGLDLAPTIARLTASGAMNSGLLSF
jgi:spermidine synthase